MIYRRLPPGALTEDVKNRILQRIREKGKLEIGDNVGQSRVIDKE